MLFQGSGVALVTPFREGAIDWEAFGRLIDFQLAEGTDALVVCGTTGEPSTMSQEEREQAVAFAIERGQGRVCVIAGCGGNDTRAVTESARRMCGLGVDGLLIVTPYYNKTTQAGMIAHFQTIADAVDRPIVVYNVPSRTGLNLLPETMAAMAEHPNLRAVKEACGDIAQIMELFRLCGDRCAIYSGNDDHVYPMLALGGQGVISVAANVTPGLMHEMTQSFFEGDWQRSLTLQQRLNPLIKQLFAEVSPIPVKAALAMMGMIQEELRLPLVPMSAGKRPALRQEMEELGLLA